MILAVRLDLTGPFAGVPVVCRQIQGLHRWLIKFDLVTDDGVHEEHETTCNEPIPLHLLAPFAQASIDELLKSGSITVTRASWRAYCLPRHRSAGKRKR